MVTFSVTPQEKHIIDDIEEVGYGELHGLQAPNDVAMQSDIDVVKHEAFQLLLKELRVQGSFDTVIIHGSLPAYATKEGMTEGGHFCVKKFKFS